MWRSVCSYEAASLATGAFSDQEFSQLGETYRPGIAASASRLVHDRPDRSRFGTAAGSNDLQQLSIVVQFEAVISRTIPRPSDTAWWGRGSPRKSAGAPFPFQASENNCCGSVAMRAGSAVFGCRSRYFVDAAERTLSLGRACGFGTGAG